MGSRLIRDKTNTKIRPNDYLPISDQNQCFHTFYYFDAFILLFFLTENKLKILSLLIFSDLFKISRILNQGSTLASFGKGSGFRILESVHVYMLELDVKNVKCWVGPYPSVSDTCYCLALPRS